MLLPRADIAREMLADELREAGADVTEVVAYRTVLAGGDREGEHDIYRMLLDRQIDAVTFTSASTVRNFVGDPRPRSGGRSARTTVVASIGPVTAEAAQQLGITRRSCPSATRSPTSSRRWSRTSGLTRIQPRCSR